MSGLIKYLVVIEEADTGYSAFSPDLPGCVAMGSSKEEVEKNMKDAVAFHLEGMDQEGLEVPKPHSFSTYLEVPA
jgi:predicted RNase H-like HicB family nuclease